MATRSLTNSTRKKKERAFYETPDDVQTGAKIVAEARNSLRTLPTERPFTPAGDHRILFGSGVQGRPPSSFSTIGAQHFSISRPPTGYRLAPIETTKSTGASSKRPRDILPTPPTSARPPHTPVRTRGLASNVLSDLPPPPQNRHPVPAISLPADESIQWGKTYSDTTLTPFPSTIALSSAEVPRVTSDGDLDSNTGHREGSSQEPGKLEPKRSLHSPALSKRSLSASVVKKVLPESIHASGASNRVASAGDVSALRNKTKREKSERPPDLPTVSHKGDTDHGQDRKKKKKSKVGSESQVAQDQSSRKALATSAIVLTFWETDILPLLQELESTSYDDADRLNFLCESLWTQLENHELMGKTGGVGGAKRRGKVLRTVFKLLDHDNSLVLLKVARIIVGMQVTGKNLLNVCKLLFALSRVESNDQHFTAVPVTGCLVEVLLGADLVKDEETLVYGLGTLKLLASCPEVREQLTLSTQIMPLLINVLSMCTQPAENVNVLIQLTGALRSLSDSVVVRETFTSTGLISHLARVLSNHMENEDIVFNISRTFSKLTLTANCLTATLQCPALLPLFLRILTLHIEHMDIVVRVCFILGNLTADNESCRSLVYFQNSAPQCLTPLLQHFLLRQLDEAKSSRSISGGDSLKPGEPSRKISDVLVKVVRLIANLSVSPEVGPSIAADEDIVSSLLAILEKFPLITYEELVINCLGTLNNLTYYADASSHLIQRLDEVTALLVNVMMTDSDMLLLEATHVCGNLSRYPAVRDILMQNKVDELAVTLLDSGRREVVYSACGLLVNLLADTLCRDNMAVNGGPRKLVEVLHDLGLGDWQLASLVCKTLWNYSEKLSSSPDCFGDQEAVQLARILTSYLDVTKVFPSAAEPSSESDLNRHVWQADFIPVAQPLLDRINMYKSLSPESL